MITIQWRHNERDGVSNHQSHDCSLNRLFRCRSKKTSKLRVTGLYEGNSPVTGEFPAQMASNAENVSIWWRHHDWQYWHHQQRWQLQIQSTNLPSLLEKILGVNSSTSNNTVSGKINFCHQVSLHIHVVSSCFNAYNICHVIKCPEELSRVKFLCINHHLTHWK